MLELIVERKSVSCFFRVLGHGVRPLAKHSLSRKLVYLWEFEHFASTWIRFVQAHGVCPFIYCVTDLTYMMLFIYF
jgi:hypothetical protein